jgi:hypothetical protein
VEDVYSVGSVDVCRLPSSSKLFAGLSRIHPKAVLLHQIHSRRALLWHYLDGLFHGIRHLPRRRSSAFEFGEAARQSHQDKYVIWLDTLSFKSSFHSSVFPFDTEKQKNLRQSILKLSQRGRTEKRRKLFEWTCDFPERLLKMLELNLHIIRFKSPASWTICFNGTHTSIHEWLQKHVM